MSEVYFFFLQKEHIFNFMVKANGESTSIVQKSYFIDRITEYMGSIKNITCAWKD